MPALLSYKHQAFWVSNGTKDLLYEIVLEVAKQAEPAAYKRLQEDSRFGYYGVSGLGFELEAFEECLLNLSRPVGSFRFVPSRDF